MGCSNGKQHGQTGNNKRRSTIKRVLRLPLSRPVSNPTRPMSYAGVNDEHQGHQRPTRPLSMFDAIPFQNLDPNTFPHRLVNTHQTTSMDPNHPSDQITTVAASYDSNQEDDAESLRNSKSTEELDRPPIEPDNWKYYIPLTLEKIRSNPIVKDLIYQNINHEFLYILNRLLRLEKSEETEDFTDWFFDELEYLMHSIDEDRDYAHKSLLLRSIEQERFDCMRYFFEHQLLPSKLDINTINDQGRHCLLMLAHKNGPVDTMEYLLTRHLSCLDTNKLDFNQFSSLHHACRHFNLTISQLLLPHTNRKLLQTENSELHTSLDYWIECLCSLKKLKPTHIQHHSDSLRLDYLLNDTDYHANVLFFQTIINHGGQLTKAPLRYIRSILPHLTFEQKLSYVDHHVNLCCTLYKNRLSTLIRDYDNFKISIQAGEILTEFIYALGNVQSEVQTRFAANTYSNAYESTVQGLHREENGNAQSKSNEQETLQSTMRMLYFKFFRLFQCIYSNPDVNVKNFHFEHIFRHVWIYWKEPVRAFIAQCREKNSSLKSQCRNLFFKRLTHYPADVQDLPINPSLKQFLTFDNQFFVVQKKY